MNIREMIEYHERKHAHVTIAALPTDKKFAGDFGVIETTNSGRIIGFHEKETDAPTMPEDPSRVYASMGNYVFSTDMLLQMIEEDQRDPDSSHDFGKDILPKAIDRAEMFAYDFNTNRIPGEDPGKTPYWRDVGTLDAFYEANMDIRAISPELPIQPSVAVAYRELSRSAGQVRVRRGRSPGTGHRFGHFRGLYHLRGTGKEFRSGPKRLCACRSRDRCLRPVR